MPSADEVSMAKKTALIAGGHGVIGRSLLKHLETLPDWEVLSAARRAPDYPSEALHLSVDLTDRSAVEAALGERDDITHLFFAALAPASTLAGEVAPNLAMLRNVVEVVERASPGFRRIILNQGAKVYGSHLGKFRTPAREDDPRHLPPNFYYSQEDYLLEAQQGKDWDWVLVRPDVVCGFSVGSPMNLVNIIAVYASLCARFRVPLSFPGGPLCYEALAQVTDAGLHAEAQVWAAETPDCALKAFNITNGDLFRWKHLWPRIAAFFGLEAGEPASFSLSARLGDKGEAWKELVQAHGLKPYSMEQLAGWGFGDYVFGCDFDVISDLTRARQAGFHRVEDSAEMFLRQFERLREERIIP